MILKVGQEWESGDIVMKITGVRDNCITHAHHKSKTTGELRKSNYTTTGQRPKTLADLQAVGGKLTARYGFLHFYKSIRK